jgi:hypothetical protein
MPNHIMCVYRTSSTYLSQHIDRPCKRRRGNAGAVRPSLSSIIVVPLPLTLPCLTVLRLQLDLMSSDVQGGVMQ